jgi:addiction module RelE/StbE family toxin
MIEFKWDKNFKKSYRKKISKNANLKLKFNECIKTFSENPFNTKLKTHKLSGILKDCWAFSIDYDCRILFKFLDKNKVLLIDIGSHDEVY